MYIYIYMRDQFSVNNKVSALFMKRFQRRFICRERRHRSGAISGAWSSIKLDRARHALRRGIKLSGASRDVHTYTTVHVVQSFRSALPISRSANRAASSSASSTRTMPTTPFNSLFTFRLEKKGKKKKKKKSTNRPDLALVELDSVHLEESNIVLESER